jgi:cytochrome c biogenesis protein CcdA
VDPALFGTSTLAAFLGGVIALAAPCCVTFLLPAYLASAFRVRTAIVAMTLVFGAGVATVLLPITLGVAALSILLSQYHGEVFILGGLMLVLLGIWSLAGKNFALPLHPSVSGDRTTVLSVYSLGLFSGAASSCCAPVLAGVLTLSAISSSLPQSTVLGLAYVTGMVSPLVVMALLWERFDFSNNLIVRGHALRIGFGSLSWQVHSTNVLAGVLFLGVGLFVIASTFLGGLETSQEQTQLGEYLRSAADAAIQGTRGVPDLVFALLLGFALVYLFRRGFRRAQGRGVGAQRGVAGPQSDGDSRSRAKQSAVPAPAAIIARGEGLDGE